MMYSKHWITLLFLILPVFGVVAQNSAPEKHYHGLRGHEDNDGVTQIYFRVYDSYEVTCPVDSFTTRESRNHLYHLDENKELVSVLSDYYRSCVGTSKNINDFKILDHESQTFLEVGIFSSMEFDGYFQYIFEGSRDESRSFSIWVVDFVSVETVGDSIIVVGAESGQNYSFVSYDDGKTWNDDAELWATENAPYDSTLWDFTTLSVYPDNSDLVWGYKQGKLVRTEDFGLTLEVVDSTYSWHRGSQIYHTSSTNTVFALSRQIKCEEFDNQHCNRLYRIDRPDENHQVHQLRSSPHPLYMNYDSPENRIYLASRHEIYISNDEGRNFEPMLELADSLFITGIYKKPLADSLYILTNDQLFLYTDKELISLYKSTLTTVNDDLQQPERFSLSQNHPNPFNPVTVIRYELPVNSRVRIDVWDLTGRHISTLIDDDKPVGRHQVIWDGSNLSSGLYIYRLQAGDFVQSRQMLLIK